jgi:hypothetical protein
MAGPPVHVERRDVSHLGAGQGVWSFMIKYCVSWMILADDDDSDFAGYWAQGLLRARQVCYHLKFFSPSTL